MLDAFGVGHLFFSNNPFANQLQSKVLYPLEPIVYYSLLRFQVLTTRSSTLSGFEKTQLNSASAARGIPRERIRRRFGLYLHKKQIVFRVFFFLKLFLLQLFLLERLERSGRVTYVSRGT